MVTRPSRSRVCFLDLAFYFVNVNGNPTRKPALRPAYIKMEVYETRLSTFAASRTKKHGLPAHPAWPLKPATHPKLTPDNLAQAGWYFRPTKAEPDLVKCFLCAKELGGWEEQDDPFVEHLGHDGLNKCGWARTKCWVEVRKKEMGQGPKDAVKLTTEEKEELPSDKSLEAARLATFGKWWPHDKKKAWLPTSKLLAKGGFIYSPTPEDTDRATCIYCHLSLAGWEPTDVPYNEHFDRNPKCAFFGHKAFPAAPPSQLSASQSTTSSRASRATKPRVPRVTNSRKTQAEVEDIVPVDENDEDYEMVEAPENNVTTPAVKSRRGTLRNAPSTVASTASTTTSVLRASRSRALSSATRSTPSTDLAASTATKLRATKTKVSAKKKVKEVIEADEADEMETEEIEKVCPSAKTARRKALSEDEDELLLEHLIVRPPKAPSPPPKSASKSKIALQSNHTRTKSSSSATTATTTTTSSSRPPSSSSKTTPFSRTTVASKPSSLKSLPAIPTSPITTAKPPSSSFTPSRIPLLSPGPSLELKRSPHAVHLPARISPSKPLTPRELRSPRDKVILDGALSARRVASKLDQLFNAPPVSQPSSSLLEPVSKAVLSATTSEPMGSFPAAHISEPAVVPSAVTDQPSGSINTTLSSGLVLTEEESKLTVEAWIRREFDRMKAELEKKGNGEMIGGFLKSAEEARRRLVDDIEVIDV
ncbi:Apoptosis inhibitor IAP1 and related BIR domain proteins [Phaffia rhodozyma]|uniref:Apoptosis inhibitor IAP1 and related BIR domain proteins n=1 Tax=Phaffia rhodozyma TaxID=264483 RepID=A0A0F7SHN9_PHARH|nr:Apoptosis inhibitor IAP1 and related BIR domain proteins [Phaffia rhodozyma]